MTNQASRAQLPILCSPNPGTGGNLTNSGKQDDRHWKRPAYSQTPYSAKTIYYANKTGNWSSFFRSLFVVWANGCGMELELRDLGRSLDSKCLGTKSKGRRAN
ncbi:hypothetical protein YC2023_011028 [Brassica napus]